MIRNINIFRLFSALLMAVILLLCTVYAVYGESSVPSLALDSEEVTVAKGRTQRITATLTNAKAKLNWESEDPEIAAVLNGNVTGKKNGTTTIKCSAMLESGEELSAVCKVTVITPVTSMKAAQAITIDIGQKTDSIEITYSPADATYQSVTWISDNEEIATVDEKGQIQGISEGTCKVTATSTEPVSGKNKAKSVSLKVTVYRPVTSVTLECLETEMIKGKTLQMNASVFPENATNKKLVWESSDTTVASVANGKVTAKAGGEVIIRCSVTNQTGEVVAAEHHLSVKAPVTSIAAQSMSNIVNVGAISDPLPLKIQPEDATCKDVAWESKDESIVTVDAEGRMTGIKAGKTSIIVTSADPYATGTPKTCTLSVTVNQGAEKLVLSGDTTIAKGKTAKLTSRITPEDTTNKKIIWTSSNEKVAKVNNGSVSAVGVGKCTITGTMADGSGVSATHDVTVIQAVTQIQPNNKNRVVVTEGKTANLSVTVLPKDATNKKVSWSSDSPSVASVDGNGKITGKNAGKCTITVKAQDGSNRSAKITVIVEPEVPLDATTFTRSGYFGAYYEFAITFKNLTKTRTIKYISFDLKYNYGGSTYTSTNFYTDSDTLGPGSTKQIGWWDQLGYRLGYCSNFRIYLRSVRYSDGTRDTFGKEEVLIGWFN